VRSNLRFRENANTEFLGKIKGGVTEDKQWIQKNCA